MTILAPYEQYNLDAHPGLSTGDAPAAGQLFDLQNDPGEQHDVAAQHPDIVERLQAQHAAMLREVPKNLNNPKRTGAKIKANP